MLFRSRAFGLANTPLFFQSIVNDQGVFVIELSPRLGGGLSYKFMKNNAHFDMLEASIDSYLGNDVKVNANPEKDLYIVHQVYCHDGVFGRLEGYEDLLASHVLDEVNLVKTPGMSISNEKSSSSRTATTSSTLPARSGKPLTNSKSMTWTAGASWTAHSCSPAENSIWDGR